MAVRDDQTLLPGGRGRRVSRQFSLEGLAGSGHVLHFRAERSAETTMTGAHPHNTLSAFLPYRSTDYLPTIR